MRKVLLLLALVAIVSQAGATNIYWKGGGTTTNWSDVSNWVGGKAPASGDSAYFANGQYTGSQIITLDQNVDLGSGNIYGLAGSYGGVTINNGGAYSIKGAGIYWYSTSSDLVVNVPIDRSTQALVDLRVANRTVTFNSAVASHDGGGAAIDKYIQTAYGGGGTTGKFVFAAPTQNTNYISFGTSLEMSNSQALPNIGAPANSKTGMLLQSLTGLTITNLAGNHSVRMNTSGGASGFVLNVNGIAPGNSGAGTIDFLDASTGGGAQLNLGGSSKFELGALGGSQDKVTFSGTTAAYSMVLTSGTLDITNLGGLQAGDYTLFDMGTKANWSGSFSAINMPTGFAGEVVKAADNDLVLRVTAVPEPATMSLLVAGGLAAMIRRRR